MSGRHAEDDHPAAPPQFAQPGDPAAPDTRVETDDDDLAAVAGCTAPEYDEAFDPHNGRLDAFNRGETDAS